MNHALEMLVISVFRTVVADKSDQFFCRQGAFWDIRDFPLIRAKKLVA